MNPLSQSELFEIAECGQQALLIEWLRENGIRYTFTRKGRVITTIEQINAGLSKAGGEVIRFGQKQKAI